MNGVVDDGGGFFQGGGLIGVVHGKRDTQGHGHADVVARRHCAFDAGVGVRRVGTRAGFVFQVDQGHAVAALGGVPIVVGGQGQRHFDPICTNQCNIAHIKASVLQPSGGIARAQIGDGSGGAIHRRAARHGRKLNVNGFGGIVAAIATGDQRSSQRHRRERIKSLNSSTKCIRG